MEILRHFSLMIAELSRYGYLITATEKNLGGVTQEAELNKRRVDDLNNLNSRIEQTIQSIPATTTHTTYSGGWWRWWWGGYRTTHERVNENVLKPIVDSFVARRIPRILSVLMTNILLDRLKK